MYKMGEDVVTFLSVPSFPPTPPKPIAPGMTISCLPRPRPPLRTTSKPSQRRSDDVGAIAAGWCNPAGGVILLVSAVDESAVILSVAVSSEVLFT